MNIRIFTILIFLSSQILSAQSSLPKMLDSLAKTSSESDRSKLSMAIASRLANDDWIRALGYIDLAEESAKNSKSEKILADFYIGVAEIYSQKDAFDISLENFIKAYNYYERQPLKERYRLENDLAIAYAETQNYDKALDFFNTIYRYEHTQRNPMASASLSNNIGLVWMHKNLDSSLVYFNKSLQLIEGLENPDLRVSLFTNLGKISILKNNDQVAKQYFKLALNEIARSDADDNLAWVYAEFSELYLRSRNLDSAIYYSGSAVEILDRLAPFGLEQLQATKVLYRSYVENKQFEKAAGYFEKFLAITDSLNLEDKRVNVQRLLIEEEYRNQDKIRNLEHRESQAKLYSLILGLFAVMMILGSLSYRYRNKLRRSELEKQLATAKQKELNITLELKNKELVGKAMIEMHRTEIIEDILKDLKEVRLRAEKKETQNAIDFISKRLKKDISTNAWEEFEIRFEQVHESFYKNLIAAHPNLTSKDRRLCALLKLNLTSKEISQITGQTPKTVENARTRLRKKLDITNSQTDLSTYLSSFG